VKLQGLCLVQNSLLHRWLLGCEGCVSSPGKYLHLWCRLLRGVRLRCWTSSTCPSCCWSLHYFSADLTTATVCWLGCLSTWFAVFSRYRIWQQGSYSGYGAPSTLLTRAHQSPLASRSRVHPVQDRRNDLPSCEWQCVTVSVVILHPCCWCAIVAETPVGSLQPTCSTAIRHRQMDFSSFQCQLLEHSSASSYPDLVIWFASCFIQLWT